VVGGIVLIALDQEPDPTLNPQPQQLRDTRTPGIIVGIVGLGAVGAGVYMWLKGGHDNAGGAPVVSMEHGGASVGWTGRF
jgi:hypothetical protein